MSEQTDLTANACRVAAVFAHLRERESTVGPLRALCEFFDSQPAPSAALLDTVAAFVETYRDVARQLAACQCQCDDLKLALGRARERQPRN